MRAIFAYLLPWLDTAGTWSALRLNFPMRHVSFVLYPFCPWSSPSNGLINQRARGVGDRPREREREKTESATTTRPNKIRLRRLAAPGSSLSFGKWPARGFLNSMWMVGRTSTVSLSFPPFFPPSLDHSSRAWAHSDAHANKMLSEMFPKREYKFKYL